VDERTRVIMLDPAPPDAAERAEAAEAEVRRRDARLRHLAEATRLFYVTAVRRQRGDLSYGTKPMAVWDGGRDAFGKNHRPIWPRLARFFVANGVDPATYIQAQFTYSAKMPLPNQMMNQVALQRYARFKEELPGKLRRQYTNAVADVSNLAQSLVRAGWDEYRSLRYALTNGMSVTASPLCRLCLAALAEQQDIVQGFYDAALIEYTFQQSDYDAAWGERIPAWLREEVTQLRALMGFTNERGSDDDAGDTADV
jgi:hypothetical protein